MYLSDAGGLLFRRTAVVNIPDLSLFTVKSVLIRAGDNPGSALFAMVNAMAPCKPEIRETGLCYMAF